MSWISHKTQLLLTYISSGGRPSDEQIEEMEEAIHVALNALPWFGKCFGESLRVDLYVPCPECRTQMTFRGKDWFCERCQKRLKNRYKLEEDTVDNDGGTNQTN